MDRNSPALFREHKISHLAFLAILLIAILLARPQASSAHRSSALALNGASSLGPQEQVFSSLNALDPCTTPVRIMPLGDSITRGSGSANLNGYRRPLYLSLAGAGYNVDFVGSRTEGSSDFDRNHEGHSGFHTWDAVKGSIAPNIYNWLTLNPADVVLLHIGTNDITTGTQSASEVAFLLNEIDRFSTDTVVVLARIINRQTYSPATTQFNLDVQAMANTRIANGDAIVVVDMENALSYPNDLRDELHPNNGGYAKMAAVWKAVLEGFLPRCNGATPTGTQASPTPTKTPTPSPTPGATTPSPTPTATRTTGCGGLIQEAEAGTLSGTFTTGSDAAASGGQYVHAPPGSGFWDTVSGNGHRADYCFTVTTAGVYRIKGWAHASTSARNSFFVQVDGGPAIGYLWDVKVNSVYSLDYVNDKRTVVVDPVEVSLGVGDHSLTFFLREDGTRLDKFELELVSTSPTATPTPTGTQASPTPTKTATPSPTPSTITPSPTPTATRTSGCGGLIQEAEAGMLSGAFTAGSDAAASGGQYVHAPPGSGFWDTVSGNGHRADYCFTVTTAGSYRIKGWVYGLSSSMNSFFVQVDGGPAIGYLWDVPIKSPYVADYVNDKRTVVVDPVEVSLGVGEHSLTFFLREDGTRLDRFELEMVSTIMAAPPTPDGNFLLVTDMPNPTAVPSEMPTGIAPSETPTATPAWTSTPTATIGTTGAPSATPVPTDASNPSLTPDGAGAPTATPTPQE